jgi:hypothetical protein
VFHVTSDEPPFHIAHGTADGTVPVGQSQELYGALVNHDVEATLRLVEGAGHGLPPTEDTYVVAFFLAHLATPPVPGDTDCDGEVGFGDINPFVIAATGGEGAYLFHFPECNWYNADIDGDGRVDFADINPFVQLLSDM